MNASPKIKQTKLEKIRPTQMSVGFVEVAKKRRAWAQVAKGDRIALLLDHAFPAVLGPGDRYFATDHHHLGRALLDEKVDSVFVSEARDFSALVLDEFWVVMDHLQWAHPYDALGVRQPFDAMPRKLSKLADDPYRGLAAQVRDAGGYAKDGGLRGVPLGRFLAPPRAGAGVDRIAQVRLGAGARPQPWTSSRASAGLERDGAALSGRPSRG